MRLGPLILQICAVLIALTLVYFGYETVRNREFKSYVSKLQAQSAPTVGSKTSLFEGAPDITCTYNVSDFSQAYQARVYVSDTLLRYDLKNLTSGITEHLIFNKKGMYRWDDNSESIEYLPNDTVYVTYRIPSLECQRWRYNSSAFELPLGKSVKNMQTLEVL